MAKRTMRLAPIAIVGLMRVVVVVVVVVVGGFPCGVSGGGLGRAGG